MNKERPINFTSESVKAILDERKTQTRRVIKKAFDVEFASAVLPAKKSGWVAWWTLPLNTESLNNLAKFTKEQYVHGFKCPYGVVGDELWVKENAYIAPVNFGDPQFSNRIDYEGNHRIVGWTASMDCEGIRCAEDYGVKQRSSMLMPRWASRIQLRITDIRVERVQEITGADCKAEGINSFVHPVADYYEASQRDGYQRLWDSINAKRGYGWDLNPWVWVIKFERVEREATK
jgi:hypothetical protein